MEDLLNVMDYNEERSRGIEHCEHDNSVASRSHSFQRPQRSRTMPIEVHFDWFDSTLTLAHSIPEYSLIPE
jgi:hypothetical protein